jgi:hypothetical protein
METDRLFNSVVASVAISAAFELGLFEELERKGTYTSHLLRAFSAHWPASI